ncbi:MAG: hypothetical protein NVSMB63_12340 [Sediminibacterium sp.]
MNLTQEKALFRLTGKVNFSDVQAAELKRFADAHPYFAPAQFLLAAKLKQEENPAAVAQITKAALFFTNPSWLQFLLSRSGLHHVTAEPNVNEVSDEETGELTPEGEKQDGIDQESPEEAPSGKIANLLSEHLADFKKPVEAGAKLAIDTERLHTIDYFASQGIKIDLSTIPQDKLTAQLRKFTDWLKQMKNPAEPTDLGTASDLENAVMMIAQNSNQSREVVTETMAEVLAKQGQVDKAIQLYIKLSFLNPEKSAYFAAKIQHLKGI